MRKNRKTYRESVFDAGEKVKISSKGSVAVPLKFDGEQEVLVVKTGNGYSIIPVLPDPARIASI